MELDGTLAQSCGAVRVGLMKPTFQHKIEGMPYFAIKQFGKRMVIQIL